MIIYDQDSNKYFYDVTDVEFERCPSWSGYVVSFMFSGLYVLTCLWDRYPESYINIGGIPYNYARIRENERMFETALHNQIVLDTLKTLDTPD